MTLIIISLFIIVILLNGLTIWAIIHRALRKKIIPYLTERGMFFKSYKWLGFFNTGDFDELTLTIGSTNASANISIYIDIYYQSLKEDKRTTVRIDTLYFFIRRVNYSSEI